jgi:zinc D-Ala-D-Ala carboxypeptidase
MKYFKLSEFACPCCGANNIDRKFVELLDKIREEYGKPMVVKSGYRCKKHNDEVGGVPESAHVDGVAADIGCSFAGDRMKLVTLAIANGITRIGIAKTFVHLDTSKDLPRYILWLYS